MNDYDTFGLWSFLFAHTGLPFCKAWQSSESNTENDANRYPHCMVGCLEKPVVHLYRRAAIVGTCNQLIVLLFSGHSPKPFRSSDSTM